MLKAFWYLIKLSLFIALAAWLAMQPGTVNLGWGSYDLSMPTGTLAVFVLVVFVVGVVIAKILSSFGKIPQKIEDWRQKNLQETGYTSLSKGFAALAAGDLKQAKKASKTAAKSLGRDDGVIALLEAMTSRVSGEDDKASEQFKILMANKETSFLGVKGLMLLAQEQDNIQESLTLARVAYRMHPKQSWVIENLYQAEIKASDWRAAEETLNKAVRQKIFDKAKANSDKIAIRLALGVKKQVIGEEKSAKKYILDAYKLDPTFTPSVLVYATCMPRSKTISAIEKAWKESPHPQLLDLWKSYDPGKGTKKSSEKSKKWFEKLISLNSDEGLAHIAAAENAIDLEHYGEARAYLRAAESIGSSKYLYKTYANLEEAETGNKDAARAWMDKVDTLMEEKVWICSQEGIVYDAWSPMAKPHNSFNTIIWDFPNDVRKDISAKAKNPKNLLLPMSQSA